MFAHGTFVSNLKWNDERLYVYDSSIQMLRWIASKGAIALHPNVDLTLPDKQMHIAANQIEIDSVMEGRSMPDWVIALQAGSDTRQTIFSLASTEPISISELRNQCNHSWKSYVGIRDAYDYCEHCDKKRRI